ncbi:MAG: hypothetical protein ACYTKD_32245 [Planctomycetota bacterium]|jgi:hypothetical protein
MDKNGKFEKGEKVFEFPIVAEFTDCLVDRLQGRIVIAWKESESGRIGALQIPADHAAALEIVLEQGLLKLGATRIPDEKPRVH